MTAFFFSFLYAIYSFSVTTTLQTPKVNAKACWLFILQHPVPPSSLLKIRKIHTSNWVKRVIKQTRRHHFPFGVIWRGLVPGAIAASHTLCVSMKLQLEITSCPLRSISSFWNINEEFEAINSRLIMPIMGKSKSRRPTGGLQWVNQRRSVSFFLWRRVLNGLVNGLNLNSTFQALDQPQSALHC